MRARAVLEAIRERVVLHNSLCALLGGVVDYAGLFPPASLSLEQAIQKYAAHRTAEHAWLVSCFVCPVGSLQSCWAYVAQSEPDSPWRFSVLGRGAAADEQGRCDEYKALHLFIRRVVRGLRRFRCHRLLLRRQLRPPLGGLLGLAPGVVKAHEPIDGRWQLHRAPSARQ